jgi:hypothetical protein
VRTRIGRRGEAGSALLLTTVLLLLLGLFGFAALNSATRDQQVAGFHKRKRLAFYAAEAGVAKALETMTTGTAPSVPETELGDTAIHPHGRPSFRPDPSVANPIEPMGSGAFPGMSLNLGQNGLPTYQLAFWRVRVQGRDPGGSSARIETVSGALLAN